ncbi:MAG TPA: extracellular solute-binding protein, partial [Herpetosiphonaceae bacterium]|nr:extracellular solute-binding protein [Herpetosiphonaceae bacterium]
MLKDYARFVAAVCMLSLLVACGSPGQATTTNAAPAGTAMAGATTSAGTGQAGASGATDTLRGKLTLAGSSALLPLVQQAATDFQANHPQVQITVTAGGSGAGRTQVCEGKIDIGNSDVKLKDDEKTKLNCGAAVETPIAIQAFAPVANKTGPGSVKSLTKQQLVNIFTGTTKNWKEVGGADQEIVLVNRAKGSGTRSQMAKFLFDGDDTKFAVGASEEDNSETVRQTVSQTPGAISYLGFAYLSNPDLLALQVDGVAPTKADIQSGAWKIGGPGYMITKGPGSPLAQALIKFVTSSEFQQSDAF